MNNKPNYSWNNAIRELSKQVLEPTEESATVGCWIARDKDGSLYISKYEPQRAEEYFYLDRYAIEYAAIEIPEDLFPSLTWENSPKRCNISIKLLNG